MNAIDFFERSNNFWWQTYGDIGASVISAVVCFLATAWMNVYAGAAVSFLCGIMGDRLYERFRPVVEKAALGWGCTTLHVNVKDLAGHAWIPTYGEVYVDHGWLCTN